MPKFIWSCSDCGTVLPLWQVKCSNCSRLAISWLHLAAACAIALSALIVVIKLI